ncbi:MAG: glycosyltransferase [Solirubrobacterales bacterium]
MARPKFVPIAPEPLDRYRPLIGEAEFEEIERFAEGARERFHGRAIWHVNSTARGGGVAELLQALLPYVRGVGIDTRWVALRESPEFFAVTKRLHNRLHEDLGDGGPLGEQERRLYDSTLAATAEQLLELTQAGDIVYLHDPQTAGLIEPMKAAGLRVVWRCHVGVDRPGELARGAWDFLRSHVERADSYVFSRRQYLWDGLDPTRAWYMPPVIDPFSPKNQELAPEAVDGILRAIGLVADGATGAPVFTRGDGTPGRVERAATMTQEDPVPTAARMVVQVSRWDRLKDPHGLLQMLDEHLPDPDLHLVLVGPETGGVADDPEGAAVYGDVVESWRRLGPAARRRAHLAALPMYDVEENAAMVNAVQRGADVVVQKSFAEGFGLTVAEAMWKRRPLVGTRVGGIQDQIADGETGLLVDDPRDLAGCAAAIETILADPARARRMGEAGRQRVVDNYLGVFRLREYAELVGGLLDRSGKPS